MSSTQQLSDLQEIILSIVPIPSAIISILGSAAIIYLACKRRKIKRWTPYNRLLVAMSACDIAFSSVLAIATFLRPKETSDRVWAFGNDASCQFIAFMIQATAAGVLYQAMLSIYFMLTSRYGMKNEKIARRIEPFMHFVAVGYTVGTATVGAAMDVYGERPGPASCRVVRYYDDSGASDAEKKKRNTLILFFTTVPVVAVILCLICTQISIYLFVRRHTREISSSGREESLTSFTVTTANGCPDQSGPTISSAVSFGDSSRSKRPQDSGVPQNRQTMPSRKQTRQSQRLQLVCSQAFLYVSSFMLCQAFNLISAVLLNKGTTQEAVTEVLVKYYPLTVINATLIPIQGLLNFIIYTRPKFLMLRRQFPREGRLWIMRRIFVGEKLPPTDDGNLDRVTPDESAANRKEGDSKADPDAPIGGTKTPRSATESTARLPREMVSSVTASEGDFGSQIDVLGDDDRWQDSSIRVQPSTLSCLASGVNRLTDLEAISEISETVFELTPYQLNGSHYSNSVALHIPTESSEGRWREAAETTSECSPEKVNVSHLPIRIPRRTTDTSGEPDSRSHGIGTKLQQASDVPLSPPKRFCSLPPSEIEDC